VTLRATGRALAAGLAGRQDALGAWARHGRRVARAVVELLDRARDQVLDGTAVVAVRDRRAQLRLNSEALDILGGAPAPVAGWDEEVVWSDQLWPAAVQLLRGERTPASDSSSRRPQAGRPLGWGARRLPEPQAWAAGLVVPALALRRGTRAALVCPVRSRRHATRLVEVARQANTGEPLLFVGPPDALAPLESAGARTAPVTAAEPAPIAAALRQAFDTAGA
jgi:hypothetical protein